jgi:hypothetical protein
MTPRYAWENIKAIIPKDSVIWEPFYGDGKSGVYLRELGFTVIHNPNEDFFTHNHGDVIVSNPPFSKSKEVMRRLKELDKPFIIILPVGKLGTQYMRELFKDDDALQIIIPKSRIHFEKQIDGKVPENWKNACCFDCFYYCWKIGLENGIMWL